MEFIEPDTDAWEDWLSSVKETGSGLILEPLAAAAGGAGGGPISAAAVAAEGPDGDDERLCILAPDVVYLVTCTVDEGVSSLCKAASVECLHCCPAVASQMMP